MRTLGTIEANILLRLLYNARNAEHPSVYVKLLDQYTSPEYIDSLAIECVGDVPNKNELFEVVADHIRRRIMTLYVDGQWLALRLSLLTPAQVAFFTKCKRKHKPKPTLTTVELVERRRQCIIDSRAEIPVDAQGKQWRSYDTSFLMSEDEMYHCALPNHNKPWLNE